MPRHCAPLRPLGGHIALPVPGISFPCHPALPGVRNSSHLEFDIIACQPFAFLGVREKSHRRVPSHASPLCVAIPPSPVCETSHTWNSISLPVSRLRFWVCVRSHTKESPHPLHPSVLPSRPPRCAKLLTPGNGFHCPSAVCVFGCACEVTPESPHLRSTPLCCHPALPGMRNSSHLGTDSIVRQPFAFLGVREKSHRRVPSHAPPLCVAIPPSQVCETPHTWN